MEKFKNQMIEGINSLIKIYSPYQESLSESERQDLRDLKACRQVLKHGSHVVRKVRKCKNKMAEMSLLLGLILNFI